MTSLDALTRPVRGPDGGLYIDIEDGWQQGRGAFGGLVLAGLARAMETAVEPSRALRTLAATLPAPALARRAALQVETLREGAGLSAITARLAQDAALCAHATGVFARERAVDHGGWQRLAPPSLGDPSSVALAPVRPPLGPVFAQHFEFRPVRGLPFTGGAPETEGWVRPRERCEARGPWLLAALADAWWPCALVAESGPRPMATVSFTLEVVGTLDGLDPDAPFYHRARSAVAREGFALETRELWGADGRLLAINHQTFAVIK